MITNVIKGLFFAAVCAGVASLFAGCAGKPSSDYAGQVQYRLVHASEPSPPSWINQPPDDANGMHFMVGLSNHEASEVGARDSAMRAARGEYARYTGVNVEEIDEVERYLNAKESEVVDAKIKGKLTSKQTTDAMVSRIKATKFYIETFNVIRDDSTTGTAYKAVVLVTIPVDEDKRVAEWKRTQQLNMDATELRAEQAAEALIMKIESHVVTAFSESGQLASRGQVLQALSRLATESQRLEDEEARVANGGDRLKKRAYRIDALERDVQQRANAIISNLLLERGRFSTVYVDASLPGQTLRGWVWYRSTEGLYPVSGLPVRIVDALGQVKARATTNESGRADFSTNVFETASYRFELDADHSTLSRIEANLPVDFAAAGSDINIVKACNDVAGATNYAVSQLFSGASNQPLPAHKLFMGPVTYSDSNVGGNFSSLVQRYLKQSLAGIEGLTVVAPRKRDVANVQQAVQTRGIGLVETVKNPTQTNGISMVGKSPSLGDASMQAVIDGAEAALVAQYDVQADGVLLDLSLKQAGTDILLASATARISRDSIPHGTELIPSTDTVVAPMQKPSGGALRIEISTHLGNGQTFQEGDVVSYFAHLDQAAYLLLVYEDADGNLIQIFPNRYADNRVFPAGTTIEVPSKNDAFEFEITAPFGNERVYAFAATRAFTPPKGNRLDNGLLLFDCSRDELFKSLRSVARSSGTAYGESSTVLTTVPKSY